MILSDFFQQHPQAAIGFSGGVDSSYLAYCAKKYAQNILAIYYKSEFQPEFEFEDAKRLCREIGAELTVLELDALSDPAVAANPADRCYHCKSMVFGTILEHMRADGRTVLLDGTNASDREDRRPGFRAIHELGVRSPLREAGLTKDRVRENSAKLGLPTANKPSYACYGAYFDRDEAITPESLKKTVDKFMASHPDAADRVRTDGNIDPSPAEAAALAREKA